MRASTASIAGSVRRRGHRAAVERLPFRPAPDRLLDVAGAGEQIKICRARLDLNAAKASHCARVQHVAGVLVLHGATQNNSLPYAGADEDAASVLRHGQTQPLLRIQVRDVGVAAVVIDFEDAAAIAGKREQPSARAAAHRRSRPCGHSLRGAWPPPAHRSRCLRGPRAGVGRLHRSRRHDGYRHRRGSLHGSGGSGLRLYRPRWPRRWFVGGTATAVISRAALQRGRSLFPQPFTVEADHRQAASVEPRSGCRRVPRERADVLLVAPEEEFGFAPAC